MACIKNVVLVVVKGVHEYKHSFETSRNWLRMHCS